MFKSKDKSLGFIIFVLLAGALVGSGLGEILGLIIPEGVVRDFFVKSIEGSFGPATLNVILLTVTIGFTIKLNVVGIVGITTIAYLLRWYK